MHERQHDTAPTTNGPAHDAVQKACDHGPTELPASSSRIHIPSIMQTATGSPLRTDPLFFWSQELRTPGSDATPLMKMPLPARAMDVELIKQPTEQIVVVTCTSTVLLMGRATADMHTAQ